MPWVDASQIKPDPVGAERNKIRQHVPAGWANHFNLLTYGAQPPGHLYGLCGHNRVCLLLGAHWVHPYPTTPRICDDPPARLHANID